MRSWERLDFAGTASATKDTIFSASSGGGTGGVNGAARSAQGAAARKAPPSPDRRPRPGASRTPPQEPRHVGALPGTGPKVRRQRGEDLRLEPPRLQESDEGARAGAEQPGVVVDCVEVARDREPPEAKGADPAVRHLVPDRMHGDERHPECRHHSLLDGLRVPELHPPARRGRHAQEGFLSPPALRPEGPDGATVEPRKLGQRVKTMCCVIEDIRGA